MRTWRVGDHARAAAIGGAEFAGQPIARRLADACGAPKITAPACVKVAAAGHTVPSKYDPRMEHPFTDWLKVLSSQNAPISVFTARSVGASGSCFSVEPSAASLAPVVEAGIFCFQSSGVPTNVTLSDASLTLIGTPAPGAPTNTLPGPITAGPAIPTKAAAAAS